MKTNRFASTLKELREERSLSQTQLAKELCISQSAIAKYENGTHEPNLDLLIKIARYFKCSTDYLLGLED